MDNTTQKLVTGMTESIVSSFITRFDSEKQVDISTLIDAEKQCIYAIMKADASGELAPEDVSSTVCQALDPFRYQSIIKQEYQGWVEILASKESESCCIKKEIKTADQTLNSEFRSEMEQIRSEINQKLRAALKGFDEKYRHHLGRYVETLGPFERKVFSAEREIGYLRAYLSPIKRLPIELKTHIISLALEDTSKRDLALVCKDWEHIILDTPTFWRKIDTNDIISAKRTIFSCATPAEYLRRQLELAKSIELDVTIDYRNGKDIKWLQPICHVLASHGVERWRSLELRNGDTEPRTKSLIQGLFKGRLRCLRSLSIVINNGEKYSASHRTQDCFSSLYRLIAQTAPPLTSFNIVEYFEADDSRKERMRNLFQKLPTIFSGTPSVRKLKRLSIPAPLLPQFHNLCLDDVEKLALSYFKGDPSLVLPRTTTLWCSLPVLESCRKEFVQSLTVHLDEGSTTAPPMTLPMVEDLTFYGEGEIAIPALVDLVAPSLRRLVIVGPEQEKMEYRTRDTTDRSRRARINSFAAYSIFDDHDRLHIAPTVLQFYVHVNPGATIYILERWSQIERLKLYWNRDFAFTDLSKDLIGRRKRGPLAPNLLEIHIEMDCWSQKTVGTWKEMAEEIMKARIRRGLPLARISWTMYERDGRWRITYTGTERITREEVEIGLVERRVRE